MSKRNILLIAVTATVLGLVGWQARRMAWDWRAIGAQLHSMSLWRIGLAIAAIWAGFVLRAVRWATLMKPQRNVPASKLITAQFIGFTAVALFGRLADLARPALIARRTRTAPAAQIAVYGIERIFDLAAAAMIFSFTLAFAPRDTPHHEAIVRAGVLATSATLTLTAIVLAIRFAGARLAEFVARFTAPLSPKAADFLREHILSFGKGLRTLRDVGSLASVLAVSLVMWVGIAFAYVETAHAFVQTPQLARLSATQSVLLMATSMGGSLLQVPILGWFTQIGIVAVALHTVLDVPVPAALAASMVLLIVTLLSLVPVGLIAAQMEGVSLREAAGNAALAEEETASV